MQSRFGHEGQADVRRLELANPDHFRDLAASLDTIICLNILQHIEDDEAALRRLYDTLQPGGRLILMVPQGPHLFCGLDRAGRHVRRYSRPDLERKLSAAGFTGERLIDFNKPGVIGWWFSGKVLGGSTLGRLPMKIYDHLVWLFRQVDPLLPWSGLSLIAVARKPGTPPPPAPTAG